MASAKTSLKAAVDKAVKGNKGYRALSVTPSMKDGHATAEGMQARGGSFAGTFELGNALGGSDDAIDAFAAEFGRGRCVRVHRGLDVGGLPTAVGHRFVQEIRADLVPSRPVDRWSAPHGHIACPRRGDAWSRERRPKNERGRNIALVGARRDAATPRAAAGTTPSRKHDAVGCKFVERDHNVRWERRRTRAGAGDSGGRRYDHP